MDLLNGEWYASQNAPNANDKKFFKFNDFAYAVVDLSSVQDIQGKVISTTRGTELKSVMLEQLDSNNYAKNLKFNSRSHRSQLVYKPILKSSNVSDERADDFGLGFMTASQLAAVTNYSVNLDNIFGVGNGDFSTNQQIGSYFGIEITNLQSTASSYMLSMVAATEYDFASYSNYVIESNESMKNLLELKRAHTVDYMKLVETNNTVSMEKHPLYSGKDGSYVGDGSRESFWKFPFEKSDILTRNMSTSDVLGKDSDMFSISTTKPRQVKRDERDEMYSLSDIPYFTIVGLGEFKRTTYARGGALEQSSLRLELPTFLEDNYHYNDNFYQEHASVTINDFLVTGSDRHLEKRRSRYVDLSRLSNPQPIKRKRTSTSTSFRATEADRDNRISEN